MLIGQTQRQVFEMIHVKSLSLVYLESFSYEFTYLCSFVFSIVL